MINRELIRLKAIQIVYAYNENEGKTIDAAEQEFLFSLDKAYELYHSLLQLMLSIDHIARRTVEMQQSRARRLGEKENIPTKFINNRFIAQLRCNEQLSAFCKKQNVAWTEDDEEFLRRTYQKITEQDFYQEYIQDGDTSYEADREVWRKIYRHVLCNNDELDEILEDRSLYWNDDKVIVDTFVLKTIRRFNPSLGSSQPLLPEFKDDADREYAVTLLRTALENETYYRSLISEHTVNWDLDRIAAMDLVILQVALAEICSFPEIPISVSINEYVEISKYYSTPRSGSYVNGMLDTLAKLLLEEGKIYKKEPSL